MRKSFFVALGLFFASILLGFLVWKILTRKTDSVYKNFSKGNWEDVVLEVLGKKDPDLEDYSYASMSLAEYNFGLLALTSEKKEKVVSKFAEKSGLKFFKREVGGRTIFTFEDRFFSFLPDGSFLKTRALCKKLTLAAEYETQDILSRYLLKLISSNPLPLYNEYNQALLKSLSAGSARELDENGRSKLSKLLEYFSGREDSPFNGGKAEIEGKNLNVRTGPGTENPIAFQFTGGETVFILDRDLRTETIAGKKGNWNQVLDLKNGNVGWIFSGFLKNVSSDLSISQTMEEYFRALDRSPVWDFESWKEISAPNGFQGEYHPTEKIALDGDTGIVLHSSKNKYDSVCRSVEEPFRDLEFYASFLGGDETIPVFTLLAGSPGDLYKAFEIEMDKESISINRNRYITGDNFAKKRFRIRIQNGGSGFQGGLIVSEKNVLSGIDSLETIDTNSGIRWKLCLPMARENSDSSLSVFQFKFVP
ncbi:SH3 domain protein [Leptospira weilii serovar Ranarum str. ICFT]|uniref:SH3 domain protein n=1 Tax=Leptospira weilii serovar Ranarum str. ICFT TaxID=1218598 RepID=N1WJ97_9LEPT|nr:SH3 domain-containing protein [Leptospira weilii]EMY77194.1 SH3 domain protein [Leptospira weilii serovar Ranarum str. ICFT]